MKPRIKAPDKKIIHPLKLIYQYVREKMAEISNSTTEALHLQGVLNVSILEDCITELLRSQSFLKLDTDNDSLTKNSKFKLATIKLETIEIMMMDKGAENLQTNVQNLCEGPLNVILFELVNNQHVLVCSTNSTNIAGKPIHLFLEDLIKSYENHCQDVKMENIDEDVSCDNAKELSKIESESNLQYWTNQLADAELHIDILSSRSSNDTDKDGLNAFEFCIEQEMKQQLEKFCDDFDTDMYTILISAFMILLHKYTNCEDLCIGTYCHNLDQGHFRISREAAYVRNKIDSQETFAALLQNVKNVVAEARKHANISVEELFSPTCIEKSKGHKAACNVYFDYHKSFNIYSTEGMLAISTLDLGLSERKYEFLANFTETLANIQCTVQFRDSVYELKSIAPMAGHLKKILTSVLDNSTDEIFHLSILTSKEIQQFHTWNQTDLHYSRRQCIQSLFEDSVKRNPKSVAIVDGNQRTTYEELNEKSNQLAHCLQKLDVGLGSVVGVCLEKSLMAIVSFVAVLKAGGSYVPLDPNFPPDRLRYFIEDSNPVVVLALERTVPQLPGTKAKILALDRMDLTKYQTNDIRFEGESESVAYILYTSGTTGKPKGVMIQHSNVIALVNALETIFAPNETKGIGLHASANFTLFHGQLFHALSTGNKVILAPSIVHIPSLPAKDEITLIASTPAGLWQLVKNQEIPRYVKAVVTGGDSIPQQLLEDIKAAKNNMNVYCTYGCTETTLFDTSIHLDGNASCVSSIGRPIPNMKAYIVDSHMQLVPVGVSGELCFSGPQISLGYLNRPEQTKQKFVPNPFLNFNFTNNDSKESVTLASAGCDKGTMLFDENENEAKSIKRKILISNGDKSKRLKTDYRDSSLGHGRLYKTGDFARFRPDGTIEVIGRMDYQVKVNGIRIDLEDISMALMSHSSVKEAVVVTYEPQPENKSLVCYYSSCVQPHPSEKEISRYLKSKLPHYMVPSKFLHMDKLPRNNNGKLDRAALQLPEATARIETAKPGTEMETVVLNMVKAVMQIKDFGVKDDLFEHGANSIHAVQLVVKLTQIFKIDIDVKSIFVNPTVETLCQHIESIINGDTVASDVFDPDREAVLDPKIVPPPNSSVSKTLSENPNHIFLTGSTGFLGVFLLSELLKRTRAVIHCLVRGSDKESCTKRIRENFEKYDLKPTDLDAARICVVVGDLKLSNFGLSDEDFKDLASKVDIIYHSAFPVNFILPYNAIKKEAISGITEVLRLACAAKLKPVHHISSVAVHGSTEPRLESAINYENNALELGKERLPDMGYARGKWVAEKIAWLAHERGLPITVLRPSFVVANSETGAMSETEYVSRLIKGSIQLNCFPRLNKPLNLIPVDYVIKAIAEITLNVDNFGKAFHLTPLKDHDVTATQMLSWVKEYGYKLHEADHHFWAEKLLKEIEGDRSNSLQPLLQFVTRSISKQPGEYPAYDCSNTQIALAHSGLSVPRVNGVLISRMIKYFIKHDFLPSPQLERDEHSL